MTAVTEGQAEGEAEVAEQEGGGQGQGQTGKGKKGTGKGKKGKKGKGRNTSPRPPVEDSPKKIDERKWRDVSKMKGRFVGVVHAALELLSCMDSEPGWDSTKAQQKEPLTKELHKLRSRLTVWGRTFVRQELKEIRKNTTSERLGVEFASFMELEAHIDKMSGRCQLIYEAKRLLDSLAA